MKQVLKITGYLILLALAGFMIWKFSYIIVWVLIAAVLSFMGHPLVRFFDSLHFRKLRIPHALSTLLSLAIIVMCFVALLAVFVPLIIKQAETISKIDVGRLTENLQGSVAWLDQRLHTIGAIPAGQTIQDFIVEKAGQILSTNNLGIILRDFLSAAGNVLIGIFSVLFIAFFFLKDENLFEEGLLLIIPEKHHAATRTVVDDSRNLLMRYFIGVILEVLAVMLLIAFGLSILGIKNALLIGFFGGIMNIIPYLGPIIGSSIGIFLGITWTLAFGSFNDLLPNIIKMVCVFAIVNFIDNNILVPLIYSKSVKSHPLEIFLVIIIGGGLAGFPGMLLAVPVYTILRVIAREFLQQFRIIKKLTETIEIK
jgi:predicted PurR-regulated permease PerM